MSYVFQPYPAWRYHATLEARIVKDEAADKALGPEWVGNPADVQAAKPEPKTELKEAPKPKKAAK